VLLAPGMGDGIQAAKAGILEVGDIFVVNKADRDGADATARDLGQMLAMGERRRPGQWRPAVLKTVATDGRGIDRLVDTLATHQAWLESSGHGAERRLRRASAELEAIAVVALRARIGDLRSGRLLPELAADVVAGRTDPFTAADRLVTDLVG
jgi:LAO/AO transport system kinase